MHEELVKIASKEEVKRQDILKKLENAKKVRLFGLTDEKIDFPILDGMNSKEFDEFKDNILSSYFINHTNPDLK